MTETIADILDQYDAEAGKAAAVPPAPLPQFDCKYADGLYFGLDERIYHSIPALSASGLKNLLVSPPDFWFRSVFNPNRKDEQSDAQIIGTAYHKRILEGRDQFYARYAANFEAPDDCLRTKDDMKAALDELSIEYKKSADKDTLTAMAANAGLPIYDVMAADYAREHAGKTFLSRDLLNSIEFAAAMVENHPELSKCFRGGYPEVTVIWTEDGIRFKARWDYVKPRAILDLKSFSNQLNKPVDRAIYSAMSNYKYHLQAAFYLRAASKARDFCYAEVGSGPAATFLNTEQDQEFLDRFAQTEEHDFFFVFTQTGIAPLARGKKFERGLMYGAGIAAIEEGIRRYRECMERFGPDTPWVDMSGIDSFDDDLFAPWACEI